MFGYGAGVNTSLGSRLDIFKEEGANQLAYAPFLGNANVAYLTSGDAGRTLHSFLANVMAELGLIGFLLIVILFGMVGATLLRGSRGGRGGRADYIDVITNFWTFLVFGFLFLYANMAVGKSWAVLWFFVGFAVSAFEVPRLDLMRVSRIRDAHTS